jgi:HK97 family phage portal protein
MSLASWIRQRLRLDDPKAWGEVIGYSTISGAPITRRSVLQLSTAWACSKLRSQVIGTLPMGVFRWNNGAPEPARDHWLYPIVHFKPNHEFTASRFWQATISALDLDGNAYLEKMIGSDGKRIVGLSWLAPALMDCERKNGAIEYAYRDPITRARRLIRPDRLVHMRQFSTGDVKGLSVIAYGAKSLGLARDTVTAAAATFGNGLRPGGFFDTGGRVLDDTQRADFTKAFISDRRGAENAGWVGLLEGGFKWQEVKINPEDAQMLESRRFDIEEICRWFNMPPIMVGHASEGQTMWGTGVEQLILQWLTTGVAPTCIDIEQQLMVDLLTPADIAEGVFIRMNIDALMRATAEVRASFLSTMVGAGLMTRNEARAKENLPPMEGGDVLTVQAQMVPLAGIERRAPPALVGAPNGS